MKDSRVVAFQLYLCYFFIAFFCSAGHVNTRRLYFNRRQHKIGLLRLRQHVSETKLYRGADREVILDLRGNDKRVQHICLFGIEMNSALDKIRFFDACRIYLQKSSVGQKSAFFPG